jgi:hypothetical protein
LLLSYSKKKKEGTNLREEPGERKRDRKRESV